MQTIRIFLAAAWVSGALTIGGPAIADSDRPVPPAKALKQAEAKLKKLLKEGEDRPSVYEARLELVRALRGLDSCDTNDRIEQELKLVSAWLERTAIPLRLSPQLVYNELGRAAQARAYCTQNEKQRSNYHEAAINTFMQARDAAKRDYDALNEAVVLFNAANSAEAMGDLSRAIALMEEACAIDREYALNENYAEDYRELVRLKDEKRSAQTPAETIDQHLAAITEDKIRLSFKATHGEQQRFRSEMTQVAWADGQRQESRLEMQYSSTVAVKGDLVTISMQPSESKVNGRAAKSLTDPAAALTPEELVAHLLAQPLSYTVKTNGEFVGTTGLDEVRRVVLAKIDAAFTAPTAAQQRDHARKLAEQLLADSLINQQVADEWAMAVGWWVDAELDIGDWYSLDVDAPQQLAPDSKVKYTYTFKVNRRLACGPADAKKSCAELIIEGRPDREQFADYLLAVVTQMAGKIPRKQKKWFRERLIEDLEMLERHVLVVDPATLKTYRQLQTTTKYMAAFEPGGQPKIELETELSELQIPPPVQRAPARPARSPASRRKST